MNAPKSDVYVQPLAVPVLGSLNADLKQITNPSYAIGVKNPVKPADNPVSAPFARRQRDSSGNGSNNGKHSLSLQCTPQSSFSRAHTLDNAPTPASPERDASIAFPKLHAQANPASAPVGTPPRRSSAAAFASTRLSRGSGSQHSPGGAANSKLKSRFNTDMGDAPPSEPSRGSRASLSVATESLQWNGEAPKRFVTLSGAKIVTEQELKGLYFFVCECQALNKGTVTVETIKTYVNQKKGQPGSEWLADLASSLSVALRHNKQLVRTGLQFKDVVQCAFPKALPHEIKFLVDAAPSIDATTGARPLTQKDLVLCCQIYGLLLESANTHCLTAGRVLIKIEGLLPPAATPEEASRLGKQILSSVPDGSLTAPMPRDRFLAFVSANQASDVALDLEAIRAALVGAEGRGDRSKPQKTKPAGGASSPSTILGKLLGRLKSSKRLTG